MFKLIALTSLAAVSVAIADPAAPAKKAEPAPAAKAPEAPAKAEKPKADPEKPFDVIFSKTIDLMEKAVAELDGVTDDASAKKAATALAALKPQSAAIAAEITKHGEPNQEQAKALMAKWGPYFQTVMMKMMAAQDKLNKFPELKAAFDNLEPKAEKKEEVKETPSKK